MISLGGKTNYRGASAPLPTRIRREADFRDVAHRSRLGFSSHSHFSATFRRTFGLSPSQYRLNIGSRRSVISATATTLSRIDGVLGTVGRSSPTVTVR